MMGRIKDLAGKALTKVFGTKNERDLRALRPLVAQINEVYESLASLSEEQLKAKTQEFKDRLARGETLDDLMIEAFAVVKEACRRNLGRKWTVVGHEITWDMVPFDVQLMGAIVLHQGKIAEMATGEGKTLVAVMPLYLNALAGRGCHLVTVNDYLARRDSEWMGEILRYLGLTVGVIQHDMDNVQRRAAYECDVTYGTNNEFGFDYLRDNMAIRKEDRVQRGHFYAIVDEVDSVLIDEARTPLIISGPVQASRQQYDKLRDPVENLVRQQNVLIGRMLNEAEQLLKEADESEGKEAEEKRYRAGIRLLQVQRGAPKNKRFLKMMSDAALKQLVHRVESDFMRDKRLHELDEDLYFSIDERDQSVNLSDEGRRLLSPGDPEYFVLPDLAEEIGKIERREDLSPRERIQLKDELHRRYAEKSDHLHSIQQLLKSYCLFERDVDYVVQDGKVVIVDEFTGRLMPGRRYSDGLHQALEAKERVTVEGETQTWATITLQNYFRMYEKLAGMTGTAETEAGEFWEIYKLDVVVIPTNDVVRRIDYNDVVFLTKREKYNAIIDEIERLHAQGRPVLVGTVSVEVSETLSRMLRRRGINHSVLNAKYHQKEAEIVAKAGQPGAVTIATNMAGRGTDIKLGPGVVKGKKCLIKSPPGVGDCQYTDDVGRCIADVPCGLHIIGTERHESRRIDRQLRGRAGRQGDPGSSRFFLSLEDDLMRLFGGERVAALMEKMGAREGEVIEHEFVTKAIERAQKRVEEQNFEIRKHLLEYDNVMNQQREVIYGLRNRILEGENLREEIQGLIEEVVRRRLEVPLEPWRGRRSAPSEDEERLLEDACEELERIFLVSFPLLEMAGSVSGEDRAEALLQEAISRARKAYEEREQLWGAEVAREVERRVYLRVIDEHWKDHLYEMDLMRSGIGLRAYGQKDPLLEYKSEAFSMFQSLMDRISEETLKTLFRAQVQIGAPPIPPPTLGSLGTAVHEEAGALAAARGGGGETAPAPGVAAPQAPARPRGTVVRKTKKVGRNDPCPCGSGKKYKHCCGRVK